MGIWGWFSATPDIAAEDGLTEAENSLLAEAEWAQDGQPFNDSNAFFHAFPDEGAVYIHENQGDEFNCTFSYGDASQAADALLTQLNSGWCE